MDNKVLQAFLDGTNEMLSMMLCIEGEVTADAASADKVFISSVMSLTGASIGQVALSFEQDSASNLVATMLGMTPDELDDETLRDGVGEMINIVAGAAKSKLSGTEFEFQLTLPTIVMGHGHRVDLFRGRQESCSSIKTDYGELVLGVWLARNETNSE